MSNVTFFSVLRNNLQCAFCNVKHCQVKYYPDREKFYYIGGNRYRITCEKERDAQIKSILKKEKKKNKRHEKYHWKMVLFLIIILKL